MEMDTVSKSHTLVCHGPGSETIIYPGTTFGKCETIIDKWCHRLDFEAGDSRIIIFLSG